MKNVRVAVARKYRVVADARDVTDGCFYVDTRRRKVGLYLKNENRAFYLDPANPLEIAKEWIHPKRVRLVRRVT